MKKSKLSLVLILTASMLFSILPSMTANAALGSKGYAFSDTSVRRRGSNNVLKGVDFSHGFTSIDLVNATSASKSMTNIIDIRIDSPTGESIIDLYTLDTNGYTSWTRRTDRIEITKQIDGVHDVYFCMNSGEMQFYSATFYYFDGSSTLYKPYGETAAVDNTEEFENIHKINFLSDLGIIETSEGLDPKIPISRIEYLKALSGFFDKSQIPDVPVGIFVDIDDVEDRRIAYFMYQKGALILEDTAYLKPHEYIKPYEAAILAANMLGYAGDARVISKLNFKTDEKDGYMRIAEMADILYKAVFYGYKVDTLTSTGIRWYEEIDKSFLNYTKNYEIGEGVVSATSYTGIYSAADTTGDYQVKINDNVYEIGDTAADEFLGVNSYYVYETDKNGIETIKAIAPVYPDGITILTSELDFTRFSSESILYENEKEKTEEIKLHPGTCIIYNGKSLDVPILGVITKPQDFKGKVIAVDNDKDKVADTVIITNARSMVINGVSEKFISSLENPIDNYTFEDGARAEFVKNGRIANAVDFSKNECVDIYISQSKKGEKLYRIVASSKSIEATLTKLSKDELSFDNGDVLELSPYSKYTPTVGDRGVFYLNNFGEVLLFKSASADDLSIGWLYKIYFDDVEELAYATLKTTENKIEKYEFAKSCYIDGVRVKDYGDLKSGKNGATTEIFDWMGKELDEPVLYNLNADGKLTVLDTINQISTKVTSYDSLKIVLPTGKYTYQKDRFFNTTAKNSTQYYNTLDGALAVKRTDTIFYNKSSLGEKMHEFKTISSLSDDAREYTGYTIGKQDSVMLDIVKINDSTPSDGGCAPFIIQSKAVVLDENDEITTLFSGTNASGAVSYTVSAEVMSVDSQYAAAVEVLKPGDMITGNIATGNILKTIKVIHFGDNDFKDLSKQSRTASNGEVIIPLLHLDETLTPSDKGYGEVGRTSLWTDSVVIGEITRFGDDYFELTRPNTGQTQAVDLTGIKVVTVGERGKDTDLTGTSSMLNVGQKVIGYFDYYVPKVFFIYEAMN